MRVSAASSVALGMSMLCAATASAQVQAGTLVRPETTTVGGHFVATLRLRVPAGAQVTFPARPDTAARVDSAGATARADSSANGFTYATVRYVLAAWDTGAQRLGLDSVHVTTAAGTRLVPLGSLSVYVRSVLPRDTSLRVPKPYRPPVELVAFDWTPWIIAAAIAALLAALLYALKRWRERQARGLRPYEIAEREFARVEGLRLIENGEPERHAVEMTRVMRAYLAAVIPFAMRSATTSELRLALRRAPEAPLERIVAILDETDAIKFAGRRATAERGRAIGVEARGVVAHVNAALEARATAMAKAA